MDEMGMMADVLGMNDAESAGVWLLRVAWGLDHLKPHHQGALLAGCDGPGGGPALAVAYGKLRRKVERRFGHQCPKDMTKYVRALRRLAV